MTYGPDEPAAHMHGTTDQAASLEEVRLFGGELIRAGWCTACGLQCVWPAIYCDAHCRAEHEQRLAVLARTGRAVARGAGL